MMFNRKLWAAFIAGAGMLAVAASSSAEPINFVQDGSVEDSEVTNSNLPDWQLNSCESDCTGSASTMRSFLLRANFATSADSNNQHEFFFSGGPGAGPDGGNSRAGDGRLSQTVSRVVADRGYPLTSWQPNVSWNMGFGDQMQKATAMVTPHQSHTVLAEDGMDFTATCVNEVLSFMPTSTNSYPPILLLDGGSLTAVPEPASLILVAAGVLGLLFFASKRRVKHQE
jgi:hypothetical protein